MIIDQTINNVGIQTLDFQLSPVEMISGRCDLLRHSDGCLYTVFAKNYFTNVKERRLYFSRSDDQGLTWLEPIELTSGYWDDDPAIIQLVDADNNSSVGVVFNRAITYMRNASDDQEPIMSRFVVTQAGALDSPIDPVTGSPTNRQFLGMCKKSTGHFIIASLAQGQTTAITFHENDVFLNNSWTTRSVSGVFGSGTNYIYAARLRKLANGDFIIMGAVRSALDGNSNLRCDLKAVISTDDCASVGAVQSLTTYPTAPGFRLDDGWKSVGDADVVQLSDGSISIVFQEFYPSQILATTTTPALPSGAGLFNSVVYHTSKNMLFAGSSYTFGSTNEGLFCIDLTGVAVTRLHTASTPAIWSNNVQRVALSADEKYLAVATDGSIDIIDTTDGTIANWTIESLRTTTTPALRNGDIEAVFFDGNTKLYFFYGTQCGLARCIGGIVDVTDLEAGITDIMVHTSLSSSIQSIPQYAAPFLLNGQIISPIVNALATSDAITGVAVAYYIHVNRNVPVIYDDVNDEIISVDTATLKRLSYDGGTFTVLETQNVSGTGDPLVATYPMTNFDFPGAGSLWYNSAGYASAVVATYYSFAERKTLGIILNSNENYHAMSITQDSVSRIGCVTPDKTWYVVGYSGYISAIPADNKGRLRYANFPYNTTTHALETAGVDFYDLVNQLRVGTRFNQIVMPHIWSLEDDRIILIAQYFAPAEVGRQFGTLIGILEPESYKIKIKARIQQNPTVTLQSRARVRQTITTTISTKARLIHMGCIKIRAHIIPRGSRLLTVRAAIRNWKYSTATISFDVQQTRKSRCRLQFSAATGYTTNQELTVRARIARMYKTRFTGHLIVPAISDNTPTVSFSAGASYRQTMTVKARISIP
jgi:hypothetical protein